MLNQIYSSSYAMPQGRLPVGNLYSVNPPDAGTIRHNSSLAHSVNQTLPLSSTTRSYGAEEVSPGTSHSTNTAPDADFMKMKSNRTKMERDTTPNLLRVREFMIKRIFRYPF